MTDENVTNPQKTRNVTRKARAGAGCDVVTDKNADFGDIEEKKRKRKGFMAAHDVVTAIIVFLVQE